MSDSMFLSIVVPVYNAEQYLPVSVAPLVSSLPHDWELLLIDDGSADGSLAYCRSLECDNVRVFTQSNAGPSAARNHGLREACGEYVTFLDADDAFAPGTLEMATEYLTTNPTDVLFLQVRRLGPDGKEQKKAGYTVDYPILETISGNEMRRLWCLGDGRIKGFFWGKIYAHRLLDGIIIPEDMRFAEDMYALSDILAKAENGVFLPIGSYDYYEREDTPTTGKWTVVKSRQLLKAYIHRWEASRQCCSFDEQLVAWGSCVELLKAER